MNHSRCLSKQGLQSVRFCLVTALQRTKELLAALAIVAIIVSNAQAAPTSLTDLGRLTRECLLREANATGAAKKTKAAIELCDLYVVLRSDPRYATSQMLRGDAAKVRRRLLGIARHREIQLTHQAIARPEALGNRVDEALVSIARGATDEDARESDDGAAPPSVHREHGGAAGTAGWGLVELIERVVAPDFWDARGGPGSIRYFAVRRVLVVRASSDVHQQIKALLSALR